MRTLNLRLLWRDQRPESLVVNVDAEATTISIRLPLRTYHFKPRSELARDGHVVWREVDDATESHATRSERSS